MTTILKAPVRPSPLALAAYAAKTTTTASAWDVKTLGEIKPVVKTGIKPGVTTDVTTEVKPSINAAKPVTPASAGVRPTGPRGRKGRERYKFRNLPASASTARWAVCGDYQGRNEHPFDVLEWCYDVADANERMRAMRRFDGFSSLYVYQAF